MFFSRKLKVTFSPIIPDESGWYSVSHVYGEDLNPNIFDEADIDSNLSLIALCVENYFTSQGTFGGIELIEEDGQGYYLDDACYGDYIDFDLTDKSLVGFRVVIDPSREYGYGYSSICPIV